jgi:hypothetical protein
MNDQRYLEMYGCTEADLIEMLEDSIGMQEMLAMSILSDAQEYSARGLNEMTRTAINRAKWVMSQIMQNKMAA